MMNFKPFRILLVDDHALFREGLAGILATQPDMKVVAEAQDGLEAVVKAKELEPDLILMDVQMPGMDGIEATKRIKQVLPNTIILMLTVRDDDKHLFEALQNGAQGYLLKDIRSNTLLQMLRGALHGEAALSPNMTGRVIQEFRRQSELLQGMTTLEALSAREQQILAYVSQGATDKEIASALNLSIHTVKTHVRNILAKLEVTNRRQAAQILKQRSE